MASQALLGSLIQVVAALLGSQVLPSVQERAWQVVRRNLCLGETCLKVKLLLRRILNNTVMTRAVGDANLLVLLVPFHGLGLRH